MYINKTFIFEVNDIKNYLYNVVIHSHVVIVGNRTLLCICR